MACRFQSLLQCLVLLGLVLLHVSCSPQGRVPKAVPTATPPVASVGLQRVSPVYTQWLLRQSLLGQAQERLQLVSGSKLLWSQSALPGQRQVLLQAAPTWLVVEPSAKLSTLAAELSTLPHLGFGGVWLSNIHEDAEVWIPETAQHKVFAQTALSLKSSLGQEQDIQHFVAQLEKLGLQSGMSILPCAPGLGPDFMLQARMSETHQGCFVLFEVPSKYWKLLPQANSEWDCQPLTASTVASLRSLGLLPLPLYQEQVPLLAQQTLWAVTGEVLGVDGKERRWVYRSFASPWQPILCWQDPLTVARQILSGSIISVTGQRRQTLTGLQLQSLVGLDVADQAQASSLLPPSLDALAELNAQIHRYGGWSISLDLDSSLAQQSHGTDFVHANNFSALLLAAWQTQDVTPLKAYLDSLRAYKQSSLAFGLGSIPFDSLQALLQASTEPQRSQKDQLALLLHATLSLPVGLPGLCFLDQNLLIAQNKIGSRLFTLNLEPSRSSQTGLSPLLLLSETLLARKNLQVAHGQLDVIEQFGKSLLVIRLRLPQGGMLLTALNFSGKAIRQELSLPAGCPAASAVCLTPQVNIHAAASHTLVLSLKARQAAHIVIGSRGR